MQMAEPAEKEISLPTGAEQPQRETQKKLVSTGAEERNKKNATKNWHEQRRVQQR